MAQASTHCARAKVEIVRFGAGLPRAGNAVSTTVKFQCSAAQRDINWQIAHQTDELRGSGSRISSFTNEFRFSYGRLQADIPRPSPRSIPEASTLPDLAITSVASPGGLGNGQFRVANNLLFQETQTKLTGRHTLRYGVEFLGQIATQSGLVENHGIYEYRDASGYSAFVNYLDDFSGPSGRIRRSFGEPVFHPTTFRHS